MKFGHILVYLIANIFNMSQLNDGDWKLVPGPFMILMKLQYNETCHFLALDIYHFQLSLIHP